MSITVSNANDLNSTNAEELIAQVWNEIRKYIKKKIIYESVQIVREKKATYVQSPNNINLVKKFAVLEEDCEVSRA